MQRKFKESLNELLDELIVKYTNDHEAWIRLHYNKPGSSVAGYYLHALDIIKQGAESINDLYALQKAWEIHHKYSLYIKRTYEGYIHYIEIIKLVIKRSEKF
jgi:hypothetical protein